MRLFLRVTKAEQFFRKMSHSLTEAIGIHSFIDISDFPKPPLSSLNLEYTRLRYSLYLLYQFHHS